jgi:3-oxoacyl-[acyl-carrier-protein] synthase II
VVVSSGVGGVISVLSAYDTFKEKGWQHLSPFSIAMLMPNGSAGWIGIEIGARAGVYSTVSACASGAEAIGYGIEMIRCGRADVVVAGGTEAPIHPLNIAGFAAMRALSTRNYEPQRASRPFDKGRDGFVIAEGAGVVVLELARHAAARGAVVHAVAAGIGYSADAHHIAQPERTGPASSPRFSTPWRTPGWTPRRSCTSTRTPPRHRSAMWWRGRHCAPGLVRTPARSRSPRPSR